MILSSLDQSISEMGWAWSWNSCINSHESKFEMSFTRNTQSLMFFFVARQQNQSLRENDRAVSKLSSINFEFVCFCCISLQYLWIQYDLYGDGLIQGQMKQLLSISKSRKDKEGVNKVKQAINTMSPAHDQQENFIYQEEFNPQDGPTDNQIVTYAEILGIKLPEEEDLLYIAKECLNEPMPEGWHCQEDKMGEIIYVNDQTGEVTFEHPCDQIFRQKVIAERKRKVSQIKKTLPKISIQKSKTSFVDNAFKAKVETPPAQQPDDDEQERDRLQHFRKSKDLGNVLGQNIKKIKEQKNEPFLYDDDYEPVNPANFHKRKKGINPINNQPKPLPKLQLKAFSQNTALKQKQSSMVKLVPFIKKQNPELVASKRKQIQERMRLKYEQLNKQLEQKQIENLKQLKRKEDHLRDADLEEIVQIYGKARVERKKKQIEMRLMLEHAQKLDKKRQEFEREYRIKVKDLSQKYQMQRLFTEMAECRKFVLVQNPGNDSARQFQEIERNMRIVTELETAKLAAEIESESQRLMQLILDKVLRQKGSKEWGWERQAQLREEFQKGLQLLLEKHRIHNELEAEKKLGAQVQPEYKREEQIKQQANSVYQELLKLKQKLKELQEDNNTQRSHLSEKQSKLVSLLQSRAGSSSSR